MKQKMKTRKCAAKRFRLTASGKIKRHKQNRRHILTKKAPGRKRQLRKSGLVSDGDYARIREMIIK